MNWIKKSATVFIFLLPLYAWPQSVIEDIDDASPNQNFEGPPLTTEKILKVSSSRRILILSNRNTSYDRGDFISLLLSNQLVVRCLVAKIHNGQAGLKITKIYNLPLWKKIQRNLKVQVIRGDDSYSTVQNKKRQEAEEREIPKSLIQEEEDLYNKTTMLEDDLTLEENTNRIIKTDNIITVILGFVEGLDIDGNSKRYNQINGSWMYQLTDNIWAEVTYGQNIINDYPNLGLDTKLANLSFKAKYTIPAPFFSYIQPYAGYQILSVSSPGAGVEDGNTNAQILALELQRVEDLKRQSAIFGVTVLKRLVPGWLARIDLGSDLVSFGFGFEF